MGFPLVKKRYSFGVASVKSGRITDDEARIFQYRGVRSR